MRAPLLLALLSAGCGDAGPAAPSFPRGFLFGTAISPYQVEGGLHQTDWAQWERSCPSCSRASADDGPGFWERYEADLGRAQAMGTNTLRLGIEWARIFPTAASFPDHPDAAAVARYQEILSAARARGQQVMVTLQHYSLPVWVQDMTDLAGHKGWEDPAIVDRFATWAGFCAARFGASVDLWLTINEPVPAIIAGWVGGVFPPGKSFAVAEGLTALSHMMQAHARAYDALHARDTVDADGDGRPVLVSYAQHSLVMQPLHKERAEDQEATRMLRALWNERFLQAVVRGDVDANFDFDLDDPDDLRADPTLAGRLDYIALNYYGPAVIVPLGRGNFPILGAPSQNDLERWGLDLPKSDFGWGIDPAGLRQILDELRPYALPVYITENGVADAADALRPRFLIDHLAVLAQAAADGIDVRGYYHWSLLDNFEWASGFCPRFGLLRVEPGTPDRPRRAGASAAVYREIVDANAVPAALFARFPGYPEPGTCPRVGL